MKKSHPAQAAKASRQKAVRARFTTPASTAEAIQHVVVLMFENRSFDHVLGCMKSRYPELEGIDPNNPGINYDGQKAYPQKPEALFLLPYGVDPKHEWQDVEEQIAGPCAGFVRNFIRRCRNKKASAPQVMAYFDRQAANRLPVLHRMAESFTICDHWFSSVPGPTWPNRFFVHSGTSQGRVFMPSGLFHHWHAYDQDTLYDRLNEKKIAWRIYHDGIPQSLMLAHQRRPQNAANYSDILHFWSDVKKIKFPQYVFIEPRYFGGYQNDEHPPANVLEGELLLAKVYNAIRGNNALWLKTLLVVLYDEHGGFYDHVPPPAAVAPDKHAEDGFDFKKLGPRVPALLISPYAPQKVVETVFDHTSLLRYLTDKWSLGPLGQRTANAKSFQAELLAEPRGDTPATISLPKTDPQPHWLRKAALAEWRATAQPKRKAVPGENDLQEGLMAFTNVLDAETKEPAAVKARRLRRMVKSAEAHCAIAEERVRLFLAQQRRVARSRKR